MAKKFMVLFGFLLAGLLLGGVAAFAARFPGSISNPVTVTVAGEPTRINFMPEEGVIPPNIDVTVGEYRLVKLSGVFPGQEVILPAYLGNESPVALPVRIGIGGGPLPSWVRVDWVGLEESGQGHSVELVLPANIGTEQIPPKIELRLTFDTAALAGGTFAFYATMERTSSFGNGGGQPTPLPSQTPYPTPNPTPTPTPTLLPAAYPAVSVSVESPSGDLVPAFQTLVAVFDIAAKGRGDVTFSKENGNIILFQFAVFAHDSDGKAKAVIFKDQYGNVLETWSFGGGLASMNGSYPVLLDFGATSFAVPSGERRQIYVYAETLDLEDDGDGIQVWLDDSSGQNLSWGINGVGNHADGDIILRGDVYAGTLVNPS